MTSNEKWFCCPDISVNVHSGQEDIEEKELDQQDNMLGDWTLEKWFDTTLEDIENFKRKKILIDNSCANDYYSRPGKNNGMKYL